MCARVCYHTGLGHADHSTGDLSLPVTGEGGDFKHVRRVGAELIDADADWDSPDGGGWNS